MGATCAKEVAPFNPDEKEKGEGRGKGENGGGSGSGAQTAAEIKMEELDSELTKDVVHGRGSTELHNLYDDLCSVRVPDSPKKGQKTRRSLFKVGGRRSFVAEESTLYASETLTEKLTGPWSVIIPNSKIVKMPKFGSKCKLDFQKTLEIKLLTVTSPTTLPHL